MRTSAMTALLMAAAAWAPEPGARVDPYLPPGLGDGAFDPTVD